MDAAAEGDSLGATRDEAAAFYAAERPRLVAGLSLYVGDRTIAEELVQEAFLRAFQRWERVARLDSPGGWTWRVALNLANSRLRRLAAERWARQRMDGVETVVVDGDTAEAVAVRRAVAALPSRQRAALVLRYFLDLTVDEAADRMDVSADAIRSLTKRGVAALRVQLGGADTTAALEEATDG